MSFPKARNPIPDYVRTRDDEAFVSYGTPIDMDGKIEALTGVDPSVETQKFLEATKRVASLREREAQLKREMAALRAQFYGGQTSHFDHERKALLAELIEGQRQALEDVDAKYTEASLDSWAHAHPTYRRWLDEQKRARENLYEAEAGLAQVRANIEAAQGEVEYHRQRVRLVEELIRFSRAESHLS